MLLGVFMINNTPRDFIHALAGHTDTVDISICHPDNGPAFSEQHRHCDFLQIGMEPYEQADFISLVPSREVIWAFISPAIPELHVTPFRSLSLRAPPAEQLS